MRKRWLILLKDDDATPDIHLGLDSFFGDEPRGVLFNTDVPFVRVQLQQMSMTRDSGEGHDQGEYIR